MSRLVYFLIIGMVSLVVFGCVNNRYGTVSTGNGENCNKYHFQAPAGIKEDKVLADLVSIKNNKSVALVTDYRDQNLFYVTVFARPSQDLEVRKLVAGLGWQSITDIPKGLKPISRVLSE